MRQPSLPPTGTVTFLFTDIEGSTKLWESDPEAMRRALACHDEIVRASIEANGGFVFKTIGDAFCAAFATAPEAVAAALDAQQSLIAEPWEVEPPVCSRIALHTGAAEERGGDYFGQPLNRIARLLAAGHGGQTLLSAATHELVRDHLPSSASLLDLGDASLKDLARPERVYQLNHTDLQFEFPLLRTLNSGEMPNNLPQQPTSFIGREKEIADVKALLQKSRLLTLVGPGGAGKTRLSLQAAADLLDGEGDGVWLVELAPLSDPALVPGAVAQAVGIKETAGQSIRKTLADSLKTKSLLLVLDNCEHVIQACALLASDLLRNCPNVHILSTSREPLGVSGERVYRIPSLSMPVNERGVTQLTPTAQSLSTFESVRLFIERAQAVQPSFTVTDQNAPAVAQICTHLDGIPLAIELAAARVRSMPVEQVNARLDSRFKLLTGGSRANLPRQQTLRALIDWSYDLLGEQEKAMLRSLSIFAGGWTLDAAEAICAEENDTGGIEQWEALDLLTSLSDKSLVVYEETQQGNDDNSARYRLLETIRQYAHDRLTESGRYQLVQHRHCSWCLELARQAEPYLTGSDAGLWLERLENEHDNMRSALTWCEQKAAPSAVGAALGLSLAALLARFWYVHGHYSEGRRWLGQALRAAEEPGTELDANADATRTRAKGLAGAAPLAAMQGDYAAALDLFQSALMLFRELGDQQGIAQSLSGLGNVYSTQGDQATARPLHEESLQIRRQLHDERGIAVSLNGLAFMTSRLGDYKAARAYYEESIQLFRRLGNQFSLSNSLRGLASILMDSCRYTEARQLHEESLKIDRRIGDLQGMSDSLNGLGMAANEQNQYAEAQTYLEECLKIRRDLGDQRGIATALGNLGITAFGQGGLTAARDLIQQCLEILRALGEPLAAGRFLVDLGEVATCSGDFESARASLDEALRFAAQSGDQHGLALAYLHLGNLAAAEGSAASAQAFLTDSFTALPDKDSPRFIAFLVEGMAKTASLRGQTRRETTLLGAAASLRSQRGAPEHPAHKLARQQAVSSAHATLGTPAFEAAWAEGGAMTPLQAIDHALADSE